MPEKQRQRERERERVFLSLRGSGWLICGAKSPLQRHTNPQSNATSAFYWFTQQQLFSLLYLILWVFIIFLKECTYGVWCWQDGPTRLDWKWGPKRGGWQGEAWHYIPFLCEKQWLKAKDGNPPPIRKKNNHKRQKKTKEKNFKGRREGGQSGRMLIPSHKV